MQVSRISSKIFESYVLLPQVLLPMSICINLYFTNMPQNKSSKVNLLKKRKYSARQSPSDEEIDVSTAINFKANTDGEAMKSTGTKSSKIRSDANTAGTMPKDRHGDGIQGRLPEGIINATIPEPDTDEYLVEADDKVKHVYQGHLHCCQHADDCSDEAHSSGEEDTVDEWVEKSDDDEEIISENYDDEIEGNELLENEKDKFCDICGENRAFDDFSEEHRLDVPPLPEWVHPDWTDIKEGDFRFCLRHSSEEQKEWLQKWRSEMLNAEPLTSPFLAKRIAVPTPAR